MTDAFVLNKAAIIERCVARVREEFADDPGGFSVDESRQDAAVLNIQRACQACVDMALHVARCEQPGIAQDMRAAWSVLVQQQWIDALLAERLSVMTNFRHQADKEDPAELLPIVLNIIQHHLDELLDFSRIMLKRAGASN